MHYFVAGVIAASMILCVGPIVAAESTITIAVFTKNTTNPAYEAFRIAADQVGRANGAQIRHFVPKQPDNVNEQKAMVEQVLKQRPDAVVFIPVDDVAMVDSVKKLNEAEIPIVLASNPLPGRFVTFVGADDYDIGYREARYLFDKIGGKGKIVILEGTAGAPTNRERLKGYKKALSETSGIEVLASAPGNYQQADGKRVMAGFLKQYPEIDALLSANDSMALGAVAALKAAGRGRQVLVAGFDNITAVQGLVKSGDIIATADQHGDRLAVYGIEFALERLRNPSAPLADRETPVDLITAETLH